MKKKKLIYFLSMVALVATSCTSDQFSDISVTETNAASQDVKSAADKVFKMEYVASGALDPTMGAGSNSACTDMAGNLYFLSPDYAGYPSTDVIINRYDVETKQVSELFKSNTLYPYQGVSHVKSICVDNQENLYYADLSSVLYKINFKEGSVVDLTSRFSANWFSGLCAADNGNVFVNNGGSIYRIAAQGSVTKVNENISSNGIFKSSGAFIYASNGASLSKASTTNGTIETYNDYRIPIQSLTAASNKNNAYALSGNTIMELRPNVAKDLLVGTIPDYIINKDGSLKNITASTMIVANADASIFYAFSYNQGENINDFAKIDIYKLTLE